MSHPWIQKEPCNDTHKLNFGKIHTYLRCNKMKKLAVNCIATQMSEQSITKLGELFRQLDKDGDGVISSEEFKETLAAQKAVTSQKQVKEMLEAIDIDRDGFINYSEFVTSCLENSIIFKK